MKKRNIIIIIIVSALLVVLLLWKSGVLATKNGQSESEDNGTANDGNTVTVSALTNDEADRTGESFDDLYEVTDYGILNPNKRNR